MADFCSKLVLLSEVIVRPVQTGFQVRGRFPFSSQGRYMLVQIKDVHRGILSQIRPVYLEKMFVPEEKDKFMQKYVLQKNDVLYLSRLNPHAFRYEKFVENTVPMEYFYILRPKMGSVDPDYLCWVLNQEFVQPYIQRGLEGTVLSFISKKALMDIKIPLPGLGIQKKIVKLLKLRMKEKQLSENLGEKKDTMINRVLNSVI